MFQQFSDRHVVPLGHIILTPSLTGTGINHTIFPTLGDNANHYSTEAFLTRIAIISCWTIYTNQSLGLDDQY